MSHSPYVPPSDEPAVDDAVTNENLDLPRIAKLRRVVQACIWIYVLLFGTTLFWDWTPVKQAWTSGSVGVVAVIVGLVGAFPVYMIAKQLRAGWQYIPLSVLTPVPLVGLFTLLSVNKMANRALR